MISDPVQARVVGERAEEFIRALTQALESARGTMRPLEFERLKRAVGQVVGTMEVELLWPLYKLHPELEPENLRGVPGGHST